MSLITIDYGSIDTRLITLVPNLNDNIGNITTAGGTFTAPQDCIMQGTIVSASGYNANVTANSVILLNVKDGGNKVWIGMNNDTEKLLSGIFIPKGTVVTTRAYGTYNLKFYSLQE